MIQSQMLTAERLRSLFNYDPDTGVFTYLTRAARNARPGDVAGSVNSEGYRNIRVDGRTYKAHRLAWLLVHGAWPSAIIDHANGARDDNRLSNLRPATRTQNLANSVPFRAGRTTHKGVSRQRNGSYSARICCAGKSTFLGYFKSEFDATAAYAAAATDAFGVFARIAS